MIIPSCPADALLGDDVTERNRLRPSRGRSVGGGGIDDEAGEGEAEGGSGKDYGAVGTLDAVDGGLALGEADVGHLLRRIGTTNEVGATHDGWPRHFDTPFSAHLCL